MVYVWIARRLAARKIERLTAGTATAELRLQRERQDR